MRNEYPTLIENSKVVLWKKFRVCFGHCNEDLRGETNQCWHFCFFGKTIVWGGLTYYTDIIPHRTGVYSIRQGVCRYYPQAVQVILHQNIGPSKVCALLWHWTVILKHIRVLLWTFRPLEAFKNHFDKNFRSCQRDFSLTICARFTVRSSSHQRGHFFEQVLRSCLQTFPVTPQKSYPKFWN